MLHTIENDRLRLTVSDHGAELHSIRDRAGREYLWQGDPAYWADRSPVLFPLIGRLEQGQYRHDGKTYSMGIHGFAAGSDFALVSRSGDALVLGLHSSPATRLQYPFDFSFQISYHLEGSSIRVCSQVVNESEETMDFALGGHPGFRVPLEERETFEDYYLEFSTPCRPDRIGFTGDTVLLNGQTQPYELENGRILPLKHSLFDEDAIILQNAARQVSLKSRRSNRQVTVTCPDMAYLGFWHWPKTDAPYVCIEPWTSLPGRSGVMEDLSCRSDFVHLAPGKTYENSWTITILQEEQV